LNISKSSCYGRKINLNTDWGDDAESPGKAWASYRLKEEKERRSQNKKEAQNRG
jgi:hypothetical protein